MGKPGQSRQANSKKIGFLGFFSKDSPKVIEINNIPI
jgi:hypothetical protein